MCFLNGGCIISLLRRVSILWPFVRNWDCNLGCIWVPLVIVLCWWVSRNVSLCVLPREACPVCSRAPVFTRVTRVCVSIVNRSWEFSNTTRIIARSKSECCGTWPRVLVVCCAVAAACSTRQGVSETVNGLVNRHVSFLKHWLESLEVTACCEVTAVNNGTNIRPFRIHRTRRVNKEDQFDLSAPSVVPCNLDQIVGINDDVWMAFVTDDRCKECVFEEGQHRASIVFRLNHRVVDLRLIEELLQFIVGILPSNVEVALAVNVDGRPVTILGTHGDDGVINH